MCFVYTIFMEVGVGYFIVKSIFHKDLKYGIIVIINIFLYFFSKTPGLRNNALLATYS